MYNAGIAKDDPRVADRFLASLTPPVQTLTRLGCMNYLGKQAEENNAWTVENIADVARDVLGDDPSKYNPATALLPVGSGLSFVGSRRSVPGGSSVADSATSAGTNERIRQRKRPDRPLPYQKSNENKFYCKMHGSNSTHGTENCYTISKQKQGGQVKTLGNVNNPCRSCGEPFRPGHNCTRRNVLALASSSDKNERQEDKISDADDTIEKMVTDDCFDCKYTSEKGVKDA